MKNNEPRIVGSLCLALAVLFLALDDYFLTIVVGGYGLLCFAIPDKLFPAPKKRTVVQDKNRRRKRTRSDSSRSFHWYQSPVMMGIVIASIIFMYYAVV